MTALLCGATATCQHANPTAPDAVLQATVRGLQQTVRLFPAQPAQGEQLLVVSVVVNHKPDSVAFTSRICGLDTKGSLELTGSLLMCAAYSMSARLAPGDSVTGFDARVVTSPPGRYTLRVRHLLVPEAWVEIPVVVH